MGNPRHSHSAGVVTLAGGLRAGLSLWTSGPWAAGLVPCVPEIPTLICGSRSGCSLRRERPDLNGAVPGRGVRARDPEGLLQVRAFDDVEAGDLLLRLGERAVGDEKLTVARAYRRGVPRRLQVIPLQVHAAGDGVVQPGRQQRLVFPALF